MKKLVSLYYALQKYLIVTLMAIMVAVTFFQVVNRTILKFNISWPEEVARYTIVWMSFVAAVAAIRKGAMISIDLITSHLKGKLELTFLVFRNAVTIFFAAIVTWYCFTIIGLQIETKQVSAALYLNMAVPYFAIPVWGILTVVETAVSTVLEIARRSKSEPAQS